MPCELFKRLFMRPGGHTESTQVNKITYCKNQILMFHIVDFMPLIDLLISHISIISAAPVGSYLKVIKAAIINNLLL